MGFNFRKSIKIGPARVNISKSGIGYSVGTKGFRVTKTAKGGTRVSAKLLGTRVSYNKSKNSKSKTKKKTNTAPKRAAAKKTAAIIPARSEPMKKTWFMAGLMAVIGFAVVGGVSFVVIAVLYWIVDLFIASEFPVWVNWLIMAGIPLALASLTGYIGFVTMKPDQEKPQEIQAQDSQQDFDI